MIFEKGHIYDYVLGGIHTSSSRKYLKPWKYLDKLIYNLLCFSSFIDITFPKAAILFIKSVIFCPHTESLTHVTIP